MRKLSGQIKPLANSVVAKAESHASPPHVTFVARGASL
jgi:hypothetical protein